MLMQADLIDVRRIDVTSGQPRGINGNLHQVRQPSLPFHSTALCVYKNRYNSLH